MTDQQHPVTPPPELVEQWRDQWINYVAEDNTQDLCISPIFLVHIATQAARWGADAELEALLTWLRVRHCDALASDLLAARRPKPPSLAEQGQRILVENGRTLDGRVELDPEDVVTIRAALERLQELENND